MLAGRNDLPWLVRFNKRFASYSDDGGQTQPGAYGARWRWHFGHDQLHDVILELKQNPESRRVVLSMWDPGHAGIPGHSVAIGSFGDFGAAISGSNDVPCNTHAYFDTIDGRLNMTVCCRSNDIIWGAYGANAVHFSFLLEFLSAAIGIPMGVYRQFSNNFHLYTNVVPQEQLMPLARDVAASDRYLMKETPHSLNKVPAKPSLRQIPLMQTGLENFEHDLGLFMGIATESSEMHLMNCTEPFFISVAEPMYNAHGAYRAKRYDEAIDIANSIKAEDWRIACVEWLERRRIKHEQNQHRFTEVAGDPLPPPDENAFGVETHGHDPA